MKKLLLMCGAAAAVALSTSAETKNYFTHELGEVFGVSDNGCYVAIGDTENNRAYLWDFANPDVFLDITPDPAETADLPNAQKVIGALAYDVTDDGSMVVGSIFYGNGTSAPAYYSNGSWTALPLHYASMNTNEAVAVTPDGAIIGGYSFIKDDTSDIAGRNYPCQWTKNANGVWIITAFTEIELPNHQGFFPTTMTSDGKIIAGRLYCGVNSVIPALVTEGQLKIFDELVTVSEPWEFAGKWYCGRDEDGKQIWTSDPNDPRIVYFTEEYIDGWKDDGADNILGSFQGCDTAGNFYGMRTLVSNASSDGSTATFTNYACIYNINTDEWTYNDSFSGFTCGIGQDLIFTSGSTMLVDGQRQNIVEEYEIDGPQTFTYVAKISQTGKVLGGICREFNEAIQDYQYYPSVTVIDGAFSGVATVYGGSDRASFTVSGRSVSVRNAESMAVYDMDGRKVAEGNGISLTPGAYVLKSGDTTAKINIR